MAAQSNAGRPAQQGGGGFGGDAFSSFMPFNTNKEPKTLAEKQAQQGSSQGFGQPQSKPAQAAPAGWDAGFFETSTSRPSSTPASSQTSAANGSFFSL